MGLRDKAIAGAFWSVIGQIFRGLSGFVLGIIIARLLAPEEYGIVAMASIFISITMVFVDSGFSVALIQREVCSSEDYSTVFHTNMAFSIFIYGLLFILAPYIALFFEERRLLAVIRVLSLLCFLSGFSIVQNAILLRNMKFKTRTQIEILSQLASGLIGIFLAFKGLGVWALVFRELINQALINLQLWFKSKWLPRAAFSMQSWKEMFAFGSKLLVSGLLDRAYQQVYVLIVGKYFPARDLGLFTRANQFQRMPSEVLCGALLGFALPIFSRIQNDKNRLKLGLEKVVAIVMFINITAMFGLGIIAKPFILVFLGEKWLEAEQYLRLLVFVGLLYPMHALNVEILKAMGRSDYFLRIEIIKKLISLPAVLLAIFVGIKAMIVGMIVGSIFSLYINTYYVKRLIDFGFFQQIKALIPSLIAATFMASVASITTFVLLKYTDISDAILLLTQAIVCAFSLISFCEVFRLHAYLEIKNILREKMGVE